MNKDHPASATPTAIRHPFLMGLFAGVLLLVSVVYLIHGFRHLVVFPTIKDTDNSAIDLRIRWVNQRFIHLGLNPLADEYDPEKVPTDLRYDAYVGEFHPYQAIYPPWAFFTASALVLPIDWQSARIYFGVFNLIAVVVTALWAYELGRRHGLIAALFTCGSVMAVLGHFSTLRTGQYGIVINALLIGALWLERRAGGVPSGLLYGMAALKPNISALFFFPFVVRRRYGTILAAAVYAAAGSLFTWVMTGVDPVTMLRQMFRHSQAVTNDGDSLLRHLVNAGVDTHLATPLLAVLGLGTTLVLMYLWRNRSMLTQFAIAAVVGRLWTYHFRYDNVMLIFLMAALAQLVLRRPSLGSVIAYLAVGLTLWIPAPSRPDQVLVINHLIQAVVWIGGLIVVLAADREAAPQVEPGPGAAVNGAVVPRLESSPLASAPSRL